MADRPASLCGAGRPTPARDRRRTAGRPEALGTLARALLLPGVQSAERRDAVSTRIIVPIFVVAFGALMAYAFYLQAQIWDVL